MMERFAVQFRHLSDDEIEVKAVPYVDGLDEMYRLCNCDTIDIVNLQYHLPEYRDLLNVVDHDYEHVVLVVDDNGKMFSKPPTLPLFHEHRVYDIIMGDFIAIIGDDHGETYGFEAWSAEAMLTAFHLYTETFRSPLRYRYCHDTLLNK